MQPIGTRHYDALAETRGSKIESSTATFSVEVIYTLL
jgi:hypothetical protein